MRIILPILTILAVSAPVQRIDRPRRLDYDSAMAMITAYGLEIPRQAFSLGGFREWVASLGDSAPRMCFSSGRLHIDTSPQDHKAHGPVVDAITDVLASLTKQRDLGRSLEMR